MSTIQTIALNARAELTARLATRKQELALAEEARKRAEELMRQLEAEAAQQHAIMEEEIKLACETAKILVSANAGIEHWKCVDEDREGVLSVMGNPNGKTEEERAGYEPVVGPYKAILGLCQQLFAEGNVQVEQIDGGLVPTIINVGMLHCTVGARLTGIAEMVKVLAYPREVNQEGEDDGFNGHNLRAMTRREICEVFKKYGMVVEIPQGSKVRYLCGDDFPARYAPGVNGELSGEWMDRWCKIVDELCSLDSRKEEERIVASREDFSKMATVGSLEDAIRVGGLYFAHIPEGAFVKEDVKHFLPEGDVLFRFENGGVTIESDENTVFVVSKSQTFEDRVLKACEDGAVISYEDVVNMLKMSPGDDRQAPRFIKERGNGNNPDLELCKLVMRHIKWRKQVAGLESEREELVKRMSREGDIPEDQFTVEKPCSAVLSVAKFNLVMPGGKPVDVAPAAIRLVVEDEGDGNLSIRAEDICEGFDHLRVKLFEEGKGKKFLAKEPGGFLSHFLKTWRAKQRE